MGLEISVGGGGISQADADTRYVNATGAETVAGLKTFDDGLRVGATGPKVLPAANTARVINSTNGQKVEVYNTTDSDTSPVNYERLEVGANAGGVGANTFGIVGVRGGTGTGRDVYIGTAQAGNLNLLGAGSTRWTMQSSGTLYPTTDNSYDIGGAANRPRTTYTAGLVANIVAKTASYTATASDHTILCDPTTGAITITLPAAASHTGRIYVIRKTVAHANAVTIDPNASETINGAATYAVADNTVVQIQCDGSNWHIISVS